MPENSYTLKVNGTSRAVRSDSDLPLLWALRDLLGLTGTKYGCGINQCRACTVLIGGTPQRSCSTAVSSVGSQEITTVEGLERIASALQEAWVAEQVPQCGYCQSGVLMAAAALLRANPKPSDADIESAIKNLCACGTYPRIRRGIKRAAGLL
ncbi:MAG: (2Fe-2S)-binding protein [Nonomuraea sp.]|nr:(2Fe-2S)-binding protein [Dermatophilaceae bacterium]NUO90450.1 (2Fe-2S)-binding protein [Dermatophilaceae bacterium]NUS04702.1 (2Fe-2S)-binding protein [Nonomuraea sp.]